MVVDEHVLHAASNCQLLQESQLDAPGPLKSPLEHGVHVPAPDALKVPAKHTVQDGCPGLANVPAAQIVHSDA